MNPDDCVVYLRQLSKASFLTPLQAGTKCVHTYTISDFAHLLHLSTKQASSMKSSTAQLWNRRRKRGSSGSYASS